MLVTIQHPNMGISNAAAERGSAVCRSAGHYYADRYPGATDRLERACSLDCAWARRPGRGRIVAGHSALRMI